METMGFRPLPGDRAGLSDVMSNLTARYLWDGAWRRVRVTEGDSMGGIVFGELAVQSYQARCNPDGGFDLLAVCGPRV